MSDHPHPVDIHVGMRLRFLRKERKISQSDLGAKLGLTFQQVQKYERGANRISASKLFEASQVLGVTVADLYLGLEAGQAAQPTPTPNETALLKIARGMEPEDLEKLITVAEVMAR